MRLTRFTTRPWYLTILLRLRSLVRPTLRNCGELRYGPTGPSRLRCARFSLPAAVMPKITSKQAVEGGVEQYVLLGAGLDTFAYRNPYAQLRVFEVDHPATQQWKRELLQRNRIAIPESVTYTPVDFERQSLSAQLRDAGFNHGAPAFFAWLGVVPYLTLEAFRGTLSFISVRTPGSGLTLDYVQPRSVLPSLERLAHDSLASRVEKAGEPFQLFFTPAEIAAEFSCFHSLEDLGAPRSTRATLVDAPTN